MLPNTIYRFLFFNSHLTHIRRGFYLFFSLVMFFSCKSIKKKKSCGGEFAETLYELLDWEVNDYLPLEEIQDLIDEYGLSSVTYGIKKKPWLVHMFLSRLEGDDNELELEIFEILVNCYPDVVNIAVDGKYGYGSEGEKYYPLHAACQNWNSQNKMIELLLDMNAKGLDHMCIMLDGIAEYFSETAGTPLHYYLSSGKRDAKTIKCFVEACPEALTMRDMNSNGFTPLHTILLPENEPDLDTVKLLVELNPSLLSMGDSYGRLPIHWASSNRHITSEVMKFLIEACPDSVEVRDQFGDLPLYNLFDVSWMEQTSAIEILKLFIDAHPRSVFQERDNRWRFPIQAAAASHGPGFCKLLVDLCPGSERDEQGTLAIFHACKDGRPETVKYLADIYPESIHMTYRGMNLLYLSICCGDDAYGGRNDKIQALHELDDSFVSTAAVNTIGGHNEPLLPLHTACMKWKNHNGSTVYLSFDLVKTLFDYYPAAILVRDEGGNLPTDLVKAVQKLQEHDNLKFFITFLETQYGFVKAAQNHKQVNELDENGLLLLHRALSVKGISIGTIKTIVNGNLSALQVADKLGRRPLHLACLNSSLDIVQYLLDLDTSLLVDLLDYEGNNILHFACKCGDWKVVNYLLDKYPSLAMMTNKKNLLPLHLLCCDGTRKRFVKTCPDTYYFKDHYEKQHIDSIWNLLLTYPSAVSG